MPSTEMGKAIKEVKWGVVVEIKSSDMLSTHYDTQAKVPSSSLVREFGREN